MAKSNDSDYFNCYHPANYQSRALTSKSVDPHGLEANDPFEPNVTLAVNTLWSFDFIALVDFFHESRCLFYYRLGSGAPEKAVAYLNGQCQCDTRTVGRNDVHVKHYEVGRRFILRTLPQVTLTKLKYLIEVDTKIYVLALREFMAEIAWLESPSAFGRRVLCDSSLEKVEQELEYLRGGGFSVTDLYHHFRRANISYGQIGQSAASLGPSTNNLD